MLQLKEHRRSWLPDAFDPSDLDTVKERYDELDARPIAELGELERWLRDRSELQSAVLEHGDRLHVALTQHSDDADARQRYLDFVEGHGTVALDRENRLDRRLMDEPLAAELDASVHGELLRAVRRDRELHCDENISLLVEEQAKSSRYDEVIGALTVEFEGTEQTIQQVGVATEDPDRDRREAAFRATGERVAQEAETLEGLFDELVQLRQSIAKNAGFDDYRPYCFQARGRVDYTPDDCLRFHDTVEEVVLPAVRRLHEKKRAALGVSTLWPWDVFAETESRRLVPFDDGDELIGGVRDVLGRVHPELGSRFDLLVGKELLDVMSRPGKAPGGYTCTFAERRLPFIFMNAAGRQGDVETLCHEGGHALHALESRDHDLLFNRQAPLEFAEVASMSLELIGNQHLEPFYSEESDRHRARRRHLEGVIQLFGWVATIDSFQHAVYAEPEQDRAGRRQTWLTSFHRFAGDVDHSGLDELVATRWLRQRHVFVAPFYYVEYGIAQVGALQVWRNYRKDPDRAIEQYRRALALGHSRPLPELFEAAGARFDLGPETVGELMELVEEELDRLPA